MSRSPAQAPVLSLSSISKRFGGTQAVDDVSLDLYAGEVMALLGENGAGKSTLIKILAGVYTQDQGHIQLEGEPEAQWRQRPRSNAGIAFIHQDLGLVEWMTVAENVALGMGFPLRHGLIDWKTAQQNAERVLSHVGCLIDPRRRVFSLTRAEKSLLAIGRALDTQARVLVLDEPTASLPMADVQRLFSVLRRLRQQGVAMIYVSHRLDEIMEISDRAAVMRDGRLVGIRTTRDSHERELVELIVGRQLQGPTPKADAQDSADILRLEGLCTGSTGPVSLSVKRGEVLGLIGLRGAGHEAVSRAIFGLADRDSGAMSLNGQAISPDSPAAAMQCGIGLVAADRLEENLAPQLNVRENLFPNPALWLGKFLARLRPDLEVQQAQALIRQFDVNPPAPQADIQNLSGGNQQKVVLARWFSKPLALLVLEEPTAGVDVGAKRQIYEILRQQANQGLAVIVVSTDFEEVAAICNRALVFRDGAITTELRDDNLTIAHLLLAASGNSTPAQTASSSVTQKAVSNSQPGAVPTALLP